MRRILEFTGEPIGTGGQEMFIVNMLRHIKGDFCIDWLTPYDCTNSLYRSEIEGRGGEVSCFGLPFNPGGLRFNILMPLYKNLKRKKYDVIHIHSGSMLVLAGASLVARLAGVEKIIVHSHSTGFKKDLRYRLLKIFSSVFLSFCPTDYCACSKIAGEWKFPQRVVDQKMIILKNGIDLKKFSPNVVKRNEIRKSLGVGNDVCLLGHVGRFSYVKNQDFLISIMCRLKKHCHSKWKLLLVGEGETLDKCIDLVKFNDLTNDIFFVGWKSNVFDYMQAMDMFLFPSRWEGLGMVAMEAQAVGVPVIASNKVPEEMKIVKDVFFLPIEDNEEEWVNKIKEITEKKGTICNNVETMKSNGYDVEDAAIILQKLYS